MVLCEGVFSNYVNVFGVFRKKIGVGMGCEPSAPAANLALTAREMKWVNSLSNLKLAQAGFSPSGDTSTIWRLHHNAWQSGIDSPYFFGDRNYRIH